MDSKQNPFGYWWLQRLPTKAPHKKDTLISPSAPDFALDPTLEQIQTLTTALQAKGMVLEIQEKLKKVLLFDPSGRPLRTYSFLEFAQLQLTSELQGQLGKIVDQKI